MRRPLQARRSAPRWVTLIGIALAVLAAAPATGLGPTPPTPADAGPPSPPNFVIVMTDDQTAEQQRWLTATNALLGDQGMTFATSYVSYPLCCPSRATLQTGQYAHNHGVLENRAPAGGFGSFTDLSTALGPTMQAAGYRTSWVGKYMNGYSETQPVPPGWDGWNILKATQWGRYYRYKLIDHNGYTQVGDDPEDYATDVLTGLATDWLTANATAGPFLQVVSYTAPHLENTPNYQGPDFPSATPAPRHAGALADEPLPMGPSFDEADVSDKPSNLPLPAATSPVGLIDPAPRLTSAEIDGLARDYRSEAESLLAVDEGVAAIIDTLSTQGVLANTYVIFTSDNGYFHGEHGITYAKFLPYEEAVRVPLLMRGPGITPGTSTTAPVANIDLVPTIYDLAGTDSPRYEDGVTLAPLFADPSRRDGWDRHLLLAGHRPDWPGLPGYTAIRTNTHLYARYVTGDTELYDLVADPHQLDNLVGTAGGQPVAAGLDRRLDALETCRGRGCLSPPFGFADLPDSVVAIDAIVWLAVGEVVSGYQDGTFRHRNPITRDEIAQWIWKLNGRPVPSTAAPYTDLTPEQWNRTAIDWLHESGIVTGYPDNTFRGHLTITRDQLAQWLWRLAGSPPGSPPAPYTDITPTQWNRAAIDWVTAQGIVTGFPDNTFRGRESIRRSQTALWFWRQAGSPPPATP